MSATDMAEIKFTKKQFHKVIEPIQLCEVKHY